MITNEILFIVDEENQLLFDGVKFKEAPSKDTKEYFSGAVLPSSFIKTYGMKIPKTIPEEKMEMQVEMSMYEDSGLDPEVEYKISSSIIELEGDDNFVEAYACEVSELEEKFEKVIKKNSHVDTIFPAPLAYTSLYAYEKLEKSNDIFIHLSEENSYAVIFKDGKYISTNSIPSLNELAKKIEVSPSEIREHLTTKGIKAELYLDESQQEVSQPSAPKIEENDDSYGEDILLFKDEEQTVGSSIEDKLNPLQKELLDKTSDELSKVVDRIARTISHKRGVFKLENIDNIYLDMQTDDIPGFLELFSAYGYEESKKSVLDVFPEIQKEQKHLAMYALCVLANAQGLCVVANLSIFDRKPPFLKTHVGVFSMVLLASFIVASAYPIYGYLTIQTLTQKEIELKQNLSKMEKATQKLQLNLKKERKIRDSLKKDKAGIIKEMRTYDAMVDTLLSLKEDTLKHQKIIRDIDISLKKYSLSSKHLDVNGSNGAIVQIVTKYKKRDDIAKFMQELLNLGYTTVQTNKIEKNETYYESFVEIQP